MAVMAELYRIESGEERTRWIFRNYPRLMRLSAEEMTTEFVLSIRGFEGSGVGDAEGRCGWGTSQRLFGSGCG